MTRTIMEQQKVKKKHTFTLEGCEVLERNVKAHGTGARVGVPKRLVGARVAVVVLEPPY